MYGVNNSTDIFGTTDDRCRPFLLKCMVSGVSDCSKGFRYEIEIVVILAKHVYIPIFQRNALHISGPKR